MISIEALSVMLWRRERLSTEQRNSTGSVKNRLLRAGHFKGESKKEWPWWKRIIYSQYYTRLRNPVVLVLSTITALTIFVHAKRTYLLTTILVAAWRNHDIVAGKTKEFRVLFPQSIDHNLTSVHFHPSPMLSTKSRRDFGRLGFHSRVNFDEPITIRVSEFSDEEAHDDSDDDQYQTESSNEDQDQECLDVSWARYSFPTCNQVHEKLIERFEDEGYNVSYLK